MLNFILLQMLQAPDGGLVYTETDLAKLFPEPLNMISAAFFLIMAVYWIIKLKGFSSHHKLLSIGTYILLIGSIGGTIYHGFRRHAIFIMMDWLPILILCTLITAYFWAKLFGNWLFAVLILLLFVGFEFLVYNRLATYNLNLATSINYALMVISAILPLSLFLIKTKFYQVKWVLFALGFFSIALFFRIADSWRLLENGTHFLWHTFGVLSSQAIFIYLYEINKKPEEPAN